MLCKAHRSPQLPSHGPLPPGLVHACRRVGRYCVCPGAQECLFLDLTSRSKPSLLSHTPALPPLEANPFPSHHISLFPTDVSVSVLFVRSQHFAGWACLRVAHAQTFGDYAAARPTSRLLNCAHCLASKSSRSPIHTRLHHYYDPDLPTARPRAITSPASSRARIVDTTHTLTHSHTRKPTCH